MAKETKVVKEVKPFGEPLIQFNKDIEESDLVVTRGLNPFFTKQGHEITSIIFFNEDGEVYKVRSGWLSKKFYHNNFYTSMTIDGGIKLKRKVSYKETTSFYITKPPTYLSKKSAELYIPVSFLTSLGYSHKVEVTERDYETYTDEYIVYGGDTELFYIPLSTKRVKHFDKKKEDMLKELSAVMTEDDFKAVLKQFDIYVR